MRFILIALLMVAASLAQSELVLLKTIDLLADTHHPQGIEFDGSRLWVTSVDKTARTGYLMEFSPDTGKSLRTENVTSGERYHPGGICLDGNSLWLPVAEYRKESSSLVQKRSIRTLEVESQFDVADHIGCIAAAPGVLIGANWDSRDFYIWDRTGRLQRMLPNPSPAAYQDMKYVGGRLVASGLLPDRTGVIDWLEYPSLRLLRRVTVGKTSRGVPYTNEGMAVRGDQVLLLPEDTASRLFRFRLAPAPAR
jgi:hypothetical protein